MNNTFTEIYLASARRAVRNNPDLAQYLRLAVADRRRRWAGHALPAGAIGGTVRNVLDDNVDSISGLEDALEGFGDGREDEAYHELTFEITNALAQWYETEISRPAPQDHIYTVGDIVGWRGDSGQVYRARVVEDDQGLPSVRVQYLTGPNGLVRAGTLSASRSRIFPLAEEA